MPETTPEMEGMAKQMQEALDKSVRRIHNVEINMYSLIKKYNISVSHAKVRFLGNNRRTGILDICDGAIHRREHNEGIYYYGIRGRGTKSQYL